VQIGVTTTFADDGDAPARQTATAIFQDISDSKRLQSMHVRAERLQAVAELSAALAHEIRNPLASIRSSVEQLGKRPSTNDDERTLTGLVVRESDRLSRLLAEFLDFARARVTRISALDLSAIARGAVNLAGQHPDRAEGVEVSCSTPADPIMIEGDEDLLHRALFNLTLNAVQAVPAHGRVRVEVSVVPRAQLPNGMTFENGAVAVHVIDDGPGIPADVRDRLFDPFFTTKQGGSGLGLAIVHRAVEAHRGFVLVDSPVAGDGAEGGTRFTVLLPRAQIASDSLSALSASDGGAPHQFAPTYEDSGVPGVIGAIS
jgi:two-component system sensor histidine kinase PilS (NtrC family)